MFTIATSLLIMIGLMRCLYVTCENVFRTDISCPIFHVNTFKKSVFELTLFLKNQQVNYFNKILRDYFTTSN